MFWVNMPIMKKVCLSLIILGCVSFGFGQVKKPIVKPIPTPTPVEIKKVEPTQKIVVEKINGDRLSGLFVGGDTDSVTIDISGAQVKIALSEIASLAINPKPQVAPPIPAVKPIETYLSIEAALVYNYGGAQPVARSTFYLLDKSAETILQEAGLQRFDSGLSYLNNYAFALKGSGLKAEWTSYAIKGQGAIKAHIITEFKTDFSGKGSIELAKTGEYWLFGLEQTRKGHAIWDLPITVVEGANKITLDQNNAKSAF